MLALHEHFILTYLSDLLLYAIKFVAYGCLDVPYTVDFTHYFKV